jgi:flagellar P-ring protein FlgI
MRRFPAILFALFLLAPGASAAVKVADITALQGNQRNILVGHGLVIGLKGTGDGGDFSPAIRPLATALSMFSNTANVRELTEVKNVALVFLTVNLPEKGALRGDELDVHVQCVGSASSINGGRLFVTPLVGPLGDLNEGRYPFGLAQGTVKCEDPKLPTSGIVKKGAVLETDLLTPSITNGTITLVLQDPAASWTTADTIAKIINDSEGDGATIAVATSAKAVQVAIPISERERPATFIARVQQLPVPVMGKEARVVINERTGTIIMTGDVEISPGVISHKGLTITTVNPTPKPTERNPQIIEKQTIGVTTMKQESAKLQELVDALDMIKVPAEDRIAIIQQLHRSGQLHAKLIIE